MYATGIVRKTDNGFRGVFTNESERGLWKVGEELFNRQLHDFPKGTLLRVVMNVSPRGRKMVKTVSVYAEKPSGEVPLPKPVEALKVVVVEMPETAPVPAPKKESLPVTEPTSTLTGYYVGPEERLAFNTALQMSLAHPERAVKLMMVGPSGYGKTSLPRLFAQLAGKAYLRMNCATVRDPEEWFGYREAQAGSTVFVRSQFAKALEAGNLVVVLDEFNRLEPWLHNTLFPLLDDDGCTVVHDERFSIGPGVVVVGTINTGYRYTGTFELDEALLNRFEFIVEVGPMPHLKEVGVLVARTGLDSAAANQVVKVANILRQNDVVCSTRTSLLVANMVVAGLTPREAFETAVVKRIPSDNTGSALRKQVVDLINVELGPVETRLPDLDVFFNLNEAPAVPEEAQEKRHEVTLFLVDKGKVQMLRMVQLVKELPVVGVKLSLARASLICRNLLEGQTVVLELETEPTCAESLAEVGITLRHAVLAA